MGISMGKLPAMGVALAACLVACGVPEDPPRSVILISLDTLRADHLGCYGHERDTSPNLDALAAEGVLFEQAVAPAPWTLPSHASLLTGRYPSRHGAFTLEDAIPEAVPTLAAVLGRAGFETAGFVNVIFLGSGFGFARGFETYRTYVRDQSPEGSASEITDAGIEWLESRRGRRVFLFLHYYDLHSDFLSLPRFQELFTDGPGRFDGSTAQMLAAMRGLAPIDASDADHLARLYDGGIRQLDEELGRLFAWLRENGWWDESLVIVTSDHGEQFLEHGGLLHNRHWEEVLRVPLILRGPTLPAGVRVGGPVSLVDVVPTVLDLVGAAAAGDVDGIDLRPLWDDGRTPAGPRHLFAEGGPSMKQATERSVRDGRHKLIVDLESGRHELYDLDADPGERNDLADEKPAKVRALRASLDRLMDSAVGAAAAPAASDAVQRQLRELGYLE